MFAIVAALAAVASGGDSQASTDTVAVAPATAEAIAAPAIQPATVAVPALTPGTPIRLMFLTEVNSRTARNGDRFKLRVDEPVYLNGVAVVPVGATAWGEVVRTEQNGAVGRGGRLGIRLLHLDLPSGRVPLRGEHADRGDGNGAGVALAIISFGLLGLFTGGDSARMKGGDTFTGYVDGPPPPQPEAVTPPAPSTRSSPIGAERDKDLPL